MVLYLAQTLDVFMEREPLEDRGQLAVGAASPTSLDVPLPVQGRAGAEDWTISCRTTRTSSFA